MNLKKINLGQNNRDFRCWNFIFTICL